MPHARGGCVGSGAVAMSMLFCALISIVFQDPPQAPPGPDREAQRLSMGRAVMPDPAEQEAVSGQVELECIAPETGPLEQCRVIEEVPLGWGFGDAALNATDTIRIRPAIQGGQPVATAMRIPFRLTAIGTVELSCGRGEDGLSVDCAITAEHPEGRGLGPLALTEMAGKQADEFTAARWVDGRFRWAVDIRIPLEPCPEIRGSLICETQ